MKSLLLAVALLATAARADEFDDQMQAMAQRASQNMPRMENATTRLESVVYHDRTLTWRHTMLDVTGADLPPDAKAALAETHHSDAAKTWCSNPDLRNLLLRGIANQTLAYGSDGRLISGTVVTIKDCGAPVPPVPPANPFLQLNPWMTRAQISALLGEPAETSLRVCGPPVNEPWACLSWIYHRPGGQMFMVMFQLADDGEWRVNSWM